MHYVDPDTVAIFLSQLPQILQKKIRTDLSTTVADQELRALTMKTPAPAMVVA